MRTTDLESAALAASVERPCCWASSRSKSWSSSFIDCVGSRRTTCTGGGAGGGGAAKDDAAADDDADARATSAAAASRAAWASAPSCSSSQPPLSENPPTLSAAAAAAANLLGPTSLSSAATSNLLVGSRGTEISTWGAAGEGSSMSGARTAAYGRLRCPTCVPARLSTLIAFAS